MNYWLMKSEPSVFGIEHLAKARNSTTGWDGVGRIRFFVFEAGCINSRD
jgi:predicted RNA-binding protein with PUA-like domain